MEIKPEKPKDRRLRFLWLLLLANIVLIFGIWQYHRLLVEVSDGATSSLYQRILRRGEPDGLEGRSLRIALLRSEPTALSFGENRAGYYHLVEMWENFLQSEEFAYRVVDSVPQGEAAAAYNLLILPAARSMGDQDREAVKRFLRSGRGVFMTWATGTRNEYGQWEQYSLLQEVAGLDIAAKPATSESDNVSQILLSGGYPLTATLYPGTIMRVTAFDQPVAAIVRESRTRIDGVWTHPTDPSLALHSLRDRAAIVHGNYFEGRFAWMGFTIGSVQQTPGQQNVFATLLRSTLLWTGHQVHAFKPVWPGNRMSLVSVTQNIETEADLDSKIAELLGRYQIPVTSFVHPELFVSQPQKVLRLAQLGEIGLLAPPELDYRTLTMQEQRGMMRGWIDRGESLIGVAPTGLRFGDAEQQNDATLDAAVRAGFRYVTSRKVVRMVPEPVRSYRPLRFVTRPRTLWLVPEMPYIPSRVVDGQVQNTMAAHYAQIATLGGYYGLSFRPSVVDEGFRGRLEGLLQNVQRQETNVETVDGVVSIWEGWDNIRISVRHVTADRASLRISNTWTKEVKDVVINVEMPFVQRELSISTMTLGTRLPDRMVSSGVRWRLYLDSMRPGGNVSYYLDLDASQRPQKPQPESVPGDVGIEVKREVW